ncbi:MULTISPECIES: hypothetical protein [unclassified Rhizobium]|nr:MULTISPECIES: hypothetical protein [unclassified Rhizobium]MBB3394461.1 hypothetical protein [Rhizobium sp. BK060]MBB4169499.1 hypothetical protein [Rhizobium sp. BK538]TCM75269.1 hypothetical protein EV291_1142 [Rhizobium sp. BK068]
MRDSENQHESDEVPARVPLPESQKFFDPWEEEFRKSYTKDDKTFEF